MKKSLVLLLALTVSACAMLEAPVVTPPVVTPPVVTPPIVTPTTVKPPVVTPPSVIPTVPLVEAPPLQQVTWDKLPGWQNENLLASWEAFKQGCPVLQKQPAWQAPCAASNRILNSSNTALREFYEKYFTPYQATQADGNTNGLVTGYYEALLNGSRTPTKRFKYPLYGVPDDLLTVDLSSVYPELKNVRVRGRLEGRKVVPYFNRSEIINGTAAPKGKELYWIDDAVELFFLHIQGSGRIDLPNGDTVHIGYADQNGHPYKSIGKILVERGELTLDKASMQGIKDWGKRNPDKLPELLGQNPSFVFFREQPNTLPGPLGALGVPLTAGRSIAIDPRYIPLGAPVFLATTWPNSAKPLNRLVMAQDTGGAIRGVVRADFFWGFGMDAGMQAGSMKQSGKMWALLPKGLPLPQNGNGTKSNNGG